MDTNEKVLTIIRGEEFKLSLKDKIDENDIFYDQYLNAAGMLDDIVAVNEKKERVSDWHKIEVEYCQELFPRNRKIFSTLIFL